MKNIWFISPLTMPPDRAVRIRTNILAKGLAKKGYAVEVFTGSKIHNTNINLIEDNRTLYIEREYEGVLYNHIRTSDYYSNGILRLYNMLQFQFRLIKVAALKKKPNVIICNPQSFFAVIPYLISRKYKASFILDVRDLWTESIVEFLGYSRNNPLIKLSYLIEKWIYKKADQIIFSMEGGKDYLIDRGISNKINMDKVNHITNGVDLDSFNYNRNNFPTKDAILNDENIFKVIYTGAIRVANNIEFIVNVAKIIYETGNENIQFLIYGDGSEKDLLVKYCTENNIKNIHFKGHVDKKYIPYILSKSNLNILHYKQVNTWKYGGSQNKLSEYIASGKPILSSIDMSYNQIRKYNCGKICNTDDAKVFAEEIISFYNMSNDEYKKYCDNASSASKELNYRKLIEKLQVIVNKV